MKSNIGIEISEQYLKFVIVKTQPPHPRIANCIVESVASLDDEQITKKISAILHANKIKPKLTVLSLARNAVTVRNLHLPSHEKKEILQMIDLNATRIVPYRKEDIIFGYRLLGADEIGYSKVILAIVHSNIIRRQTKIIERAGLFVDAISLSTYGIWEWVVSCHRNLLNHSDIYLLLDVEYNYVDFVIFSQNAMLFSRSITIGSRSIYEDSHTGIIKLLGEVKQSLIMFSNEEMNKKPSTIFISGAVLNAELIHAIESDFDMPIRVVGNPVSPELQKTKNLNLPQDTSLTAVSALAFKDSDNHIKFVLPEIQIRKSLREKTREIIVMGSFLSGLFMMICAAFLGRVYLQQSYLAKLKENYNSIAGEMKELINQRDKIKFAKVYLENRRQPLLLFSQLQKSIPDEIAFNTITIDVDNTIIMRGQALELSDVFKFVNTMEKTKYFKDVQTKSTRKKKVKEKDITEFELFFSIR